MILNNKLPVLNVANTSGTNGVYGMSGLSSGTGAVVNVINNYVGGNIASTGASVPAVFSLMYIQDNATYNIYNNTFNYQSLTNATEKSNIHISGASCTVNLKNNIIINKTDDSKAYCIWKSNGTLTSDYNNLYVSGANANIGYLSSATTKDRKALADWQTAFTPNQDVHSKSKDVNFVSATDLSLGASIDDIDLAAPAIDMVTTDIFGNDRHTPNVYMGAHEPTNLNDTRTFTVTVPQGTEHVYIAGTFLGKNWNYTDPFELTATANPNEFYGTFPAHSDVQYKYLCNKGDWDYQEAGSVNPLTAASNHTYNANDMVAYWYAMPKVKLNVSINGAVPSNLYVKGGWDNWTTPIALTASSTPLSAPQQKANSESNATMAFTGIIGNGTTDKIPANTEYKYYTTDMTDPNLEANADGSASNNRWTLYPLMNDEIARFTTEIATGLGTTKEVEVVILRTPSGIAVTFDGTATVELYNMKGSLIEKTTATGKYSRDLESGAYIIRINGKATKFVR